MIPTWLVATCGAAPDVLGEAPWSKGWDGVVGIQADGSVVGWQERTSTGGRLIRARDGGAIEVVASSALAAAVSGDGRVVAWVVAPGDVRLETDGRVTEWHPEAPIDDLRSAWDRVVGLWSERQNVRLWSDGDVSATLVTPGPKPLTIADPRRSARLPDCPGPGEVHARRGDTWVRCGSALVPLAPTRVDPGIGIGPYARLVRSDDRLIYEGAETWTLPPDLQGHPRLLAGGRIVVAATGAGGARAWRADGSEIRADLGARLVAAPDGRTLAFHEGGRVVRVDTASGARLDDVGHARPAVAMAGSPDGRRLVSTDGHGEVLTWEVATGRVVDHRRLGTDTHAVAVRDDGRTAVCTQESDRGHTLVLWGGKREDERLPLSFEPMSFGPAPHTVGFSDAGAPWVRGATEIERFDLDGRSLGAVLFDRREPTCADLDGYRWCAGGTPDIGLWRYLGDERTFVPLLPAPGPPRAVEGGLVLTGRDADWFVAVRDGAASPPLRMPGTPSKVSSAAGSRWARAGEDGIVLVPLEGVRVPTVRQAAPPPPSPPAAPVRRPGRGRPVTLVVAIDGTGSFQDQTTSALAAGFAALDALEDGWTPDDRVGLVTFHHRYAQIRSPLVSLADPDAARTLREALAAVDVASKPTRDGGWSSGGDRPNSPREYPDEFGSDPSVGLEGALAVLGEQTGRRVILLMTDGITGPPGPGELRARHPYVEQRWPETVSPLHPTRDEVFAAGLAAADRAEAAGIEIWVLAQGDPQSCALARPASRCLHGASLPSLGTWADTLRTR